MAKKRREEKEGNETYEVWIAKLDGTWSQVVERGNDGIFDHKPRALAIAGSKAATTQDCVEVLVIERRPIASFNGPAISQKGQVRAGQLRALPAEKKEGSDGNRVHGDRPQEGQVPDPGLRHEGAGGVPGPAGEAGSTQRGG